MIKALGPDLLLSTRTRAADGTAEGVCGYLAACLPNLELLLYNQLTLTDLVGWVLTAVAVMLAVIDVVVQSQLARNAARPASRVPCLHHHHVMAIQAADAQARNQTVDHTTCCAPPTAADTAARRSTLSRPDTVPHALKLIPATLLPAKVRVQRLHDLPIRADRRLVAEWTTQCYAIRVDCTKVPRHALSLRTAGSHTTAWAHNLTTR